MFPDKSQARLLSNWFVLYMMMMMMINWLCWLHVLASAISPAA